MQIRFSGTVDPSVIESFKRLYLQRSPIYPILYLALAVLVIVMGWLEEGPVDPKRWAFWLAIAAGLVYVALFAPKMAYGRWSRALQGKAFAGSISEEGVQLDSSDQLIPWRSFFAAKIGERAAILYLSRADGVPLHRAFFDSDSAWLEARRLASEHVQRVVAAS